MSLEYFIFNSHTTPLALSFGAVISFLALAAVSQQRQHLSFQNGEEIDKTKQCLEERSCISSVKHKYLVYVLFQRCFMFLIIITLKSIRISYLLKKQKGKGRSGITDSLNGF